MSQRIYLMFGIQGSGKGTQAALLSEKINVPHISMGDLLRQTALENTDMGNQIRGYIEKGNLVPDEVIMPIFRERFLQTDCRDGFILDGFPRKLSQAIKLEDALAEINMSVTKAINLVISEQELLDRLSSRLVCNSCGAVFNTKSKLPTQEGICDICDAALEKRADDQDVASIQNRVRLFHETTGEAIEHYRNKNLLLEVNGEQSIKEVFAALLAKLNLAAENDA